MQYYLGGKGKDRVDLIMFNLCESWKRHFKGREIKDGAK